MQVESDHLGDLLVQVAAEHALAAADVEGPLRSRRQRIEHDAVQMDVVVPSLVPHGAGP